MDVERPIGAADHSHPYGYYTTDVHLSAAAAGLCLDLMSSFPEGTTIVSKSAGRLLQRGASSTWTILGDEAKVRLRGSGTGVTWTAPRY